MDEARKAEIAEAMSQVDPKDYSQAGAPQVSDVNKILHDQGKDGISAAERDEVWTEVQDQVKNEGVQDNDEDKSTHPFISGADASGGDDDEAKSTHPIISGDDDEDEDQEPIAVVTTDGEGDLKSDPNPEPSPIPEVCGDTTITITDANVNPVVVLVNGARKSIPTGEEVDVSPAVVEALRSSDVEFTVKGDSK